MTHSDSRADSGSRLPRLLAPAMLVLLVGLALLLGGCGGQAQGQGILSVTASTSFLADIAQHVAGDRFTVSALIPDGIDPHNYEPGPRDVARVVQGDLFIANGGGLEGPLLDAIKNAGGGVRIVDASAGLQPRAAGPAQGDDASSEIDPHFWLDPVLAQRYVANLRDAFTAADPTGAAVYRRNAASYTEQLKKLDAWTRREVAALPPDRRVLVTDHESYGYFADRYGFRIIGAIVPSASGAESPSAKQLASLVAAIRRYQVKAIFIDKGENPQLADQIAAETGANVVATLLDHSLTPAGGPAPTYIDMIRYDVRQIVGALT